MAKQKAITTKQQPGDLARLNDIMGQAGKAANKAAAREIFTDHIARKAGNTERRKRADLALFETFLNAEIIPALQKALSDSGESIDLPKFKNMMESPEAWQGVTWGYVDGFKNWMLGEGYAIASINGKLSTVRTYAKLAAKAGAIDPQEATLINSVQGYANKERKHIDDRRRADGLQVRKSSKKAEAVNIPEDIAQAMTTAQDDATPQDRRDILLMCLLLEHGLRVGEAAILTRAAFDLKAGTLTFDRPKVSKTQTHTLTPATREAWKAYAKHAPESGIIWRKSNKGKAKLSGPMSETSATRALTKRVELIGRRHGLEGLSAHDCRHYWATFEARNNTPVDRLMDAGGWNSPAMPLRYIESARIANSGTAKVKAV